jgi:hypothetical protein
MRGWWLVGIVLVLGGCGRYFPKDLHPVAQQAEGMTVNDDGSIAYTRDRLSIVLKPMSDAELNRQFPAASKGGASSVNPYTFGDWVAPGENWTPARFTVMKLSVANYQFPKVIIDPLKATIRSAGDSQVHASLTYAELYDYYRSYWLGRTGQGRIDFKARTDLLKQTLFKSDAIFSGREAEGYLVFPLMDDDVALIQVRIEDLAIRFNYKDQPVETLDLTFSFERDVLRGNTPADAVRIN